MKPFKNECPYCDGGNIGLIELSYEDDFVSGRFECENCGKEINVIWDHGIITDYGA